MSRAGLNILIINWQDIRHPQAGGAEVHLHEIFRRVAREHRVTLLCCRFSGAPPEETLDGIRIVRRGNRRNFNWIVPSAYRTLRRQRFDIVLDDLNKIPFFTPLFAREPVLAIVHHFFGKSIFLEASPLAAGYVYGSEQLVRLVYRRTPFAAVSESSRRELESWKMHGEIDLLPNGIDLAAYRSTSKASAPLIGYLGRLKKYKSVDHIIRALPLIVAQVPQAKLLIIGGGDDLPRLQRLAHDSGVGDRIEFTGRVSHEEKVRRVGECALIVNPSPKEGWGLTVIEANALGVPVAAADSPGLRDSVVDGKTGVLYPYGDVRALAETVVALLKDDGRRRTLSENARAWAQKWSWDESARTAVELIEKTIRAAQRGPRG